MPQAPGLGYRIQYTQWHTMENGRHTQKWVDTMEVGIAKKKSFSSGRSACFFEPMVVKLVGQ